MEDFSREPWSVPSRHDHPVPLQPVAHHGRRGQRVLDGPDRRVLLPLDRRLSQRGERREDAQHRAGSQGEKSTLGRAVRGLGRSLQLD